MNKPKFTIDQVNSASYAAKRFGEIRKKAKKAPQFISDNNNIDTVVLDYKEYEKMYKELTCFKELAWEFEVTRRIEEADTNPNQTSSLKEIMDDKDYIKYQTINADAILDEELFEDE